MSAKITPEQRQLISELLDRGEKRHVIAEIAHVTPGQVSALAAHRTMRLLRRQRDSAKDTQDRVRSNLQPDNGAAQPDSRTIPLGREIDGGTPVVWDPENASNPHLLILGESGSGKTYTASRLVVELARKGYACIVLDYGQGFSMDNVPTRLREQVTIFDLSREGIGINPLQIYPSDTHGPATVAQRVADTFIRVYPRLGVQQHALLRRAVVELLEDSGIRGDDKKTWSNQPPPFRDLEQKLLEYAASQEASLRRVASATAPHVSTLFFFNTFRRTGHALSWSDLLARGGAAWILALGGLELSVERAVTEFLLWSLIRHFEMLGPAPLRCFVVLDEAHKLAFGPGSPVEKVLREGRKFGLGVILASQQPEDFSPVAFANTAAKIVFQTGDQTGMVSRQLHRKVKNNHSYEYIAKTIGTLPRGSAYVVLSNIGRATRMLSFDAAGLDPQ
jgi:hypothetical protein